MNKKTIDENKKIKSEILRLQRLEASFLNKTMISDILMECCAINKRIIFNKPDVNYLLDLSQYKMDYIIDKYDLTISKSCENSKKIHKIIGYSDFVQHFATPYILKNLNLAEKEN